MSTQKNRKLCWNCEGSVHVNASKCAYCSADLNREQPAPTLFAKVPEPVYQAPPPADPLGAPSIPTQMTFEETKTIEPKTVKAPSIQVGSLLPLLLLLPGAFFLLFGLILFLFSQDGVLTLQWNAKYWMFYASIALPLLYFGWRSLAREEVESELVQQQLIDD